MKKQKSIVYTLIFLLTFTSFISLFPPTQATLNWTDITLPYTITHPGHYRITEAWTSTPTDTQGLIISASDVVVDGQNQAISITSVNGWSAPFAVYAESQSNVLLENINIAIGHNGIGLVSCTNFTVENCVTADIYQSGVLAFECSDFKINHCNSTGCYYGLRIGSSKDFNITSCNAIEDGWTGAVVTNCTNFSIGSCTAYNTTINNGLMAYNSENFTISDVTILNSQWNGFTAVNSSNYLLQNSKINGSVMQGFWGGDGKNVTIQDCTFEGNEWNAIYTNNLTDFTVTYNTIINNTQAAFLYSTNATFSNNFVATNGLDAGNYWGGFQATDSNCTVVSNIFDRNFDAIMWETYEDTSQNLFTVKNNVFQSNHFTFYFDYGLPLGVTNQKLVFSNNLVNDTAYVDPVCLQSATLPFADRVVNLNSTLQLGLRPYSNGPQISGNFWAHPDGTGYSQTGIDADKDGFIDTPFDLFNDEAVGSAFDYNPYSLEFDINTWVPFTLPATITQPGNYRLASSWSGSTTALVIASSDVVFDGQNNLIQMSGVEGEYGIAIAPGSSNVVVSNINVAGADMGLLAIQASFAVQSSQFTNITSCAILALEANDCIINQSLFSNNTFGLIAVQSSNLAVTDCQLTNNSMGLQTIQSSNLTIQSCYLNNNTDVLSAIQCTNLDISNCSFIENIDVITAILTTFAIDNVKFANNTGMAVRFLLSDLTAKNFEAKNNLIGLYALRSNFSATYASLTGNMGAILALESNATILDCELKNNLVYGVYAVMCNSTSIDNCSISNNEYGISAGACQNLILGNSLISNNSFVGLEQYLVSNALISGNIFSENGIQSSQLEDFGGAILSEDTNCTVTNNAFNNNFDALMIGIFDNESINTQSYYYNTFNNNSFTFDFNYRLPSNFTNQQIYFYNNYVNDNAYVNPESFTHEGQLAPTSATFHLNTTLQLGTRVTLDGGRMIGGNYWAYQNGTGPSQIGVDANHDGFIDAAFDLFGNQTVFDYLPYSSSYEALLVYTEGASQSLARNQPSTIITVQLTDYFGPITTGTTVSLSSNSTTGKFYSDAACSQEITSITIQAGSSSASFYYKDTSAGNPVISAFAQGVTSATTQFAIAPHAETVDYITISPMGATVATGGSVSYTTTAYDVYGNAWNVTASYAIEGQPIGGNTVVAYFPPGVYIVEAVYGELGAATSLTVTAGPLDYFAVITPSSAVANSPFTLTVIARDSFGNVVTGFTGKVNISVNGSGATLSGAFTAGTWTGAVTIADAGAVNITVTDGNGHSGSSTIMITSETTTPTPSPSPGQTIKATTSTGATINLAIDGNITASQITGVSLTSNPTAGTATLSFSVTGQSGTTGFCNITVPKSQVSGGLVPVVLIDGVEAQNQGYTQDSLNYYVWFTTEFSTHQVKIEFAEAPTNPTASADPLTTILIVVALVALLAIAAAVIVKRTRGTKRQAPQ